jgi:alpha-ketoglutarate-dependent taurine dioxygenase
MNDPESKAIIARKLASMRRRPLVMSNEGLVRKEYLEPSKTLPLVVRPTVKGIDLARWAVGNRDFIEEQLAVHGGILFRDFNVITSQDFEAFVVALCGELLEYNERSSPRSRVSGNIYTSTDYPADQSIFLHNENSYQHAWPMKIFFFCATAAAEGGETPIADVRRVYDRLPPEIRNRFAEKKWMCVRNFGDGFGLPWQTVFQTEDKSAIEQHCGKSGIQIEWREPDRLRTRAVRPAVSKHPKTGEMVWFNHATFFHVSTLQPNVRDAMTELFKEEDLPSNTYYGDGSEIEPETLESLRDAYRAETVSFPWREGDVMLLDNMMVAHGRAPYAGERKVLVGMAQPMTWEQM